MVTKTYILPLPTHKVVYQISYRIINGDKIISDVSKLEGVTFVERVRLKCCTCRGHTSDLDFKCYFDILFAIIMNGSK